MKTKILFLPAILCSIFLVSCEEEQTTTVSKSLWGNDTIVSRSDSYGSYTRTEYGNNIFGQKTISVSRGHENATEQGDLVILLLKAAFSLLSE